MNKLRLRDGLYTIGILVLAWTLNMILVQLFNAQTLVPMLFVLGVFVVSFITSGYLWGIITSLVGVLAVNYAFTYPYYAFDLITPECLASAIVMLLVAIMTCTLTTKLKHQEKIRAERDKERMRANLLRAVSHDLRTPLTSIYGSCSAIIENYDYLSSEQHLKHLNEMKGDAEWLIRMVENLLSVTRINGEKVRVAKTPTVLEELIDNVLVKFRKHYPNVVVETEIPDEFISIPMDAMLIEQVLINMLENAVNHAEGMTRMGLKVEADEECARFCVWDDGCGIPSERMKDLFTGYLDRGNTPMDGSRKNMGIGLSVCATIIKAHGSEITAVNRPEGGAAFYFSLELEEEDEQ